MSFCILFLTLFFQGRVVFMRLLLLLAVMVCTYAGFADALDGDFENQLKANRMLTFQTQGVAANTLFWSESEQSLIPRVIHSPESEASKINRTPKAGETLTLGDLRENTNFRWEQPKNEARFTISESLVFSNISFENLKCLVLKIQGHRFVDRIKITPKEGTQLTLDGIINPKNLLLSFREKGPEDLGFYIQNAAEVTFYSHATWSETLALPVTVVVGAAMSLVVFLKIYDVI
jgi:hypothetical protein